MAVPSPTDKQRFTYADLLTWPDDERWELIDGVAYDMTPAPTRRHQQIAMALSAQFYRFLQGKSCEVYPAPFDVRLPSSSENAMTTSTIVQPDITIVCDREKLDEQGCLGSPTLVVEILSPATGVKDWREKFHLYERVGVPEYWIISPFDETLAVFILTEQGRYGAPTIYGPTDQAPVGVLPGLIIALADVFAE